MLDRAPARRRGLVSPLDQCGHGGASERLSPFGLFDDGGVGDVAVNLTVLGGFAVVAVGAAVWWLDRVLRVRGGL